MRLLLLLALTLGAGGFASVLVLAFGNPDPALVANGDFEDGTTGWQAIGGTIAAVNDPSGDDHAGALQLTLTSMTVVQGVKAHPGYSYRLTGSWVGPLGNVTRVQPDLQVFES